MSDLLSAVLTLEVASISKPGGRQANEDAYRFSMEGPLACFAISDGVGGEVGGELAARAVVDTILAGFAADHTVSEHALAAHLDAAKKEVTRQQSIDPVLRNMSATVAAVMIDCGQAQAYWGHLGDSRIYQFRRARTHRMTRDHSAVQQLVDAGFCSAEKLRSHPLRSSLLGAVGIAAEEGVDFSRRTENLEQGDALLLCTDGFWEWITEADMESSLAQASTASQWLSAMETIAQHNSLSSRHPRDNYTAIALRVTDRHARSPQA